MVPFQVNRTSLAQSTAAKVGQVAIIGADHGRVELQLLDRVGHPALAETLPRQRGHRPLAQHRPHRQLEGAGVGTGDDADAMRVGKLEHFAHQVDAIGRAAACRARRDANGRARRVKSLSGVQPGGLAQGPDEKRGRAGSGGLVVVIQTLLAESTRRVGTAWPAAISTECAALRNANRHEPEWCSAQRADFSRILIQIAPAKRFIALSRRLVPPRGT